MRVKQLFGTALVVALFAMVLQAQLLAKKALTLEAAFAIAGAAVTPSVIQ